MTDSYYNPMHYVQLGNAKLGVAGVTTSNRGTTYGVGVPAIHSKPKMPNKETYDEACQEMIDGTKAAISDLQNILERFENAQAYNAMMGKPPEEI